MKSLPRNIIRDSNQIHATWDPGEIYFEPLPVEPEVKKETVLSFFGTQELPELEAKGKKQILHSVDGGRQFNSWNPNDISWEPVHSGVQSWSFIEILNPAVTVIEEDGTEESENTSDVHPEISAKPLAAAFDSEKAIEEILMQARAQADEIILDAQAAADSILQQAQEEIDHQKQEAYQLGLSEARLETQRQFEEALKATRMLTEDVREWQKSLLEQGETIIVDMVKDIAQVMFGEGVKLDGTALQLNLNRILESAQGLGDLNIFLNPRDARLLDPSWSEYQLLISGDKVKIIPSENIKPGGCFVKGSMGMVDARVETQLAAVLNSFDEHKEEHKDENG